MKKIAVIYHSAHGHTAHIAKYIVEGARGTSGVEVVLLRAEDVATSPDDLSVYDGVILGSPTYLGGVSAPFKAFMDSTGRLWRSQSLRGKVAGGFTVSSLPAGDKQSTLMSMFVFAMQHGMIWVGNPFLPGQNQGAPDDEAVNRLGSWSGLMAQAGHGSPPDTFVPGDTRTALLFGQHFASVVKRLAVEIA